ncbi:hypothetical protein CALCODRAFT_484975 [Calocera cornea HHB12733]|uniref:Protein HRI1 n=1 Tax=Calocera cornea HHB12733 TaxID=1353952 RepID=A0A165ENI9_9BASI|nr:hypothetical protein CALCODRAFT_484975 [Calocera cornea HHB12733]
MSATTRVSIAWPPDYPPQETTDTVVLSFPSKYFLDLRFQKDASPAELIWGFAGRTETSGKLTTFIHLIDSRNPLDPLSVEDSGEFEILPNGDESESGTMVHPETGQVVQYVETWRKLPKSTIGGAVCLESSGDDGVKAFLGRVGTLFQGICARDGRISVVRRALDDKGKWKELLRSGDDVDLLPVIGIQESTGWSSGQTVVHGGRDWVVRDVEQ